MASGFGARIGLGTSAVAHLEPGEEIVVVGGAQAVDFWKGKRGIENQPTPSGVRFIKRQMGVVITTRRFLMLKIGAISDRVEEVLTDLPVAEVDSIVCKSYWWKAFEAHLTIHGSEYTFLIPHIGWGREMEKALDAAKRGDATA